MITNLIVVNLLQCICTSSQHTVHLKFSQCYMPGCQLHLRKAKGKTLNIFSIWSLRHTKFSATVPAWPQAEVRLSEIQPGLRQKWDCQKSLLLMTVWRACGGIITSRGPEHSPLFLRLILFCFFLPHATLVMLYNAKQWFEQMPWKDDENNMQKGRYRMWWVCVFRLHSFSVHLLRQWSQSLP